MERDNSHFKLNGHKSLNQICYASFSYGGSAKNLTVYHPRMEENEKYFKLWVEFVTNHTVLGKSFKTKDYETGIKNGWEIDVEQPHNLNCMAITMLRMIWENPALEKSFVNFLEFGFSAEESVYLSNIICVDEDVWEENTFNTNHITPPRFVGFKSFLKFEVKIDEFSSIGRDKSSGGHGSTGSWKEKELFGYFYHGKTVLDGDGDKFLFTWWNNWNNKMVCEKSVEELKQIMKKQKEQ